jgi:hypothetical protein
MSLSFRDLFNWTSFATNQSPGVEFPVTDVSTGTNSKRFIAPIPGREQSCLYGTAA